MSMPVSLRKPETEARYQEYLTKQGEKSHVHECCFCRELGLGDDGVAIIKQWQHWTLMKNDFPYDYVYKDHDLLFLNRHVSFSKITVEELEEYETVKKELLPTYHQKLENIGKTISQPGHFHVHLCRFDK